MRILHIVDTLTGNGRTTLLQELVRKATPSFGHMILALRNSAPLAHRFNEMGIEVHALNLYAPLRGLRRKVTAATRTFHFKPDVCLCWSGDANVFSVMPRLFGVPVIWTIHNSTSQWRSMSARLGVRCSAFLSKLVPEKIICCSNKTHEVYRDVHRYSGARLVAIANGVDVSRFRPDKIRRASVRRELGIPNGATVVSTAAWMSLKSSRRGGPQGEKDLETLLRAAAIVCRQKTDTCFLLFGLKLDYDNEQLVEWLQKYELHTNVRLLGFQDDVSGLLAASDIYAMSSTSEGLPISLAEAMSTGLIPVCTDAGDIRAVVGSAGLVVPQKDPAKLAAAILYVAGLGERERAEYSKAAIETVSRSYNIELVVERYIDVLVRAISSCAH